MKKCKTCRFADNWKAGKVECIEASAGHVTRSRLEGICHYDPVAGDTHENHWCGKWEKIPMTWAQCGEALQWLGGTLQEKEEAQFYVAIKDGEDFKLVKCARCRKCGKINDTRLVSCSWIHKE